MFFYIGDDCSIKSMKQVEPRLFLDEGWNQLNSIWYKGYSTECSLKDSLADILDGYKPDGKWCVIYNSQIFHPVLRGFPIYELKNNKTNLNLEGYSIKLYSEIDPTEGSTLSLDEVSHEICKILVENTENLYKYNHVPNMTVIFSAGLDTLTSWAVIDTVTKDYTVSIHLPTYKDKTYHALLGTRRDYHTELMDKVSQDYWGYNIACFSKEYNWNITGYYAEVYTYRGLEAINAIANYHGKRIDELASETDYLYWVLKRPVFLEKYKDSKLEFSNDADLKKFIWSKIWYNHSMWHLDNNLMFSPFADIRIPNLVHRLSVQDMVKSCVSGQIQKNIIDMLRPDLLPLLSNYKNERDVWGNFRKNFTKSMIHPGTKLIYR
jgi:hypothetical protein